MLLDMQNNNALWPIARLCVRVYVRAAADV